MNETLITHKLYTEALGCPVAMTELVRKFSQDLTVEQRDEWVKSLTGDEAGVLGATLSAMLGNLVALFTFVSSGFDDDWVSGFLAPLYEHARANTPEMQTDEYPETYEAFLEMHKDKQKGRTIHYLYLRRGFVLL